MRKRIIAVVSTLLLFGNTVAEEDRAKKRARCDALQGQMSRIHARMRQPYKAGQGEKYRDKLKKLRLEWARRCR